MPQTDAEYLAELKEWRAAIVAELKTPGTVSAFGGMADAMGPVSLKRMAGRAQLLSELALIESKIAALELASEPFWRESYGYTG